MAEFFTAWRSQNVTVTDTGWWKAYLQNLYAPNGGFWRTGTEDGIHVSAAGKYEFFTHTYTIDGYFSASNDFGVRLSKNGNYTSEAIVDNPYAMSTGMGTGILDMAQNDFIEWSGILWNGFISGAFFHPNENYVSGVKVDSPRIGWTQAYIPADYDLWGNLEYAFSWAVDFDTVGAHNGGNGFVAPAGTKGVLVTVGLRPDLDSNDTMQILLRIDGVEVARRRNDSNRKEPGGQFGVFAINPGQTLRVSAYYSNASYRVILANSTVTLEWL